MPDLELRPATQPSGMERERREAMAAASEPAHPSALLDTVRFEAPPESSWPEEPAAAAERPAQPLKSEKERSRKNRAKPEKARREKPPKEGKLRGEEAGSKMHDEDKATKRRLSREERKAAKAAALLESLDRQLPAIGGGPPIQRPLSDPTRLSPPIQPPTPPSLAEWSKSFAPPTAWTEPIATTYVQKRAMLAAMKGAKGDKNATSQPGTANEPRATTSQAGRLAPRFGAPKTPEPSPPPSVVTSRPVMGDLSRPRFAAPFNYPTPGGSKPSYPTVQPNKTVPGWSPATESTMMLNPYFRKYAKPIEPEDKAVPYWQRKLENPNASQQIRLIAQNWIMRTAESKQESGAKEDAGAQADEQVKVPDITAPVPTNVWLPKLPKLPEPRQEQPAAEAVEFAEAGEVYEAKMRAPAAAFESEPEERPDEYPLREETYSSAERWTSLKDFAPQEEALQQAARREAASDEDLDWESMVRKPKLSRRKRRKAAEADWAPPAAELEFREPEPAANGHEPEYEHREPEPEIRRRRGSRGRRRAYDQEALPASDYLGEADDVERVRRIDEPEYDLDEERAAARYREAELPAEDRYARRATGEFEVPGEYDEPPRRRRRPAPPEPELGYREPEPVRGPRERRTSGRDTELLEMDRFTPVEPEPEIVHEEVRRPSRADLEAERVAGRPAKVRASRSATLVEDGLTYVLVDDEGRAVLN